MPKLVFHTYFGEFSGDTPKRSFSSSLRTAGGESVRIGPGRKVGLPTRLWKRIEGRKLPASPDEPGAAKKMLACLVEVDALQVGPKPLQHMHPKDP